MSEPRRNLEPGAVPGRADRGAKRLLRWVQAAASGARAGFPYNSPGASRVVAAVRGNRVALLVFYAPSSLARLPNSRCWRVPARRREEPSCNGDTRVAGRNPLDTGRGGESVLAFVSPVWPRRT
jgi:hypothetical protein